MSSDADAEDSRVVVRKIMNFIFVYVFVLYVVV